jgi:hypothetical protein
MPGTLEYTCKSCSHKLDVTEKSFYLGLAASPPDDPSAYEAWEREHLQWLETNTRTYVCDLCWLSLTFPVVLASDSWETWKCSNAQGLHPYTDYPFLISVVSRIDIALKNNNKPQIDLGAMSCPYCAGPLSVRREFSPTCPECGGAAMEFTGGGIASLGIVWPPIA